MNCFYFIKSLDEDLYQRYLLIEESIKNHNSSVYLNMQIYLEHLFKYVSKRQGYNLHTKKKLGEILVDYRIENYCHVKIEYDKLNVLKAINHYGNKYKHNKILDFNFQQFMLLMQEIYVISTKIFNYYNQIKSHQIIPLDSLYFHELTLLNDKVEHKLIDLETNLNSTTIDLKIKERELIQVQQQNEMLKSENKILKKKNKSLSNRVTELKKNFNQKTIDHNMLKTEHIHLVDLVKRDMRNTLFPYMLINEEIIKKIKMH